MSSPRYRDVNVTAPPLTVIDLPNGEKRIECLEALTPYALRTTDRLKHWATVAPTHTFMARRHQGGDWMHLTYGDLWHKARAVGEALLAMGLSNDRPIAILSENSLEHAVMAFAAQIIGVPFAPVSTAYSLLSKDYDKLHHVMKLLTPGVVFASDAAKYGPAITACVPADVKVVLQTGELAGRSSLRYDDLLKTTPTAKVDAAREATNGDSIVKFLFTSGSTKMPKAVVNTQRMLCANVQMINQSWPFQADAQPVMVDWLPWSHTFGGNHNINMTLFNGGTLYIDEGKPVPGLFNETLRNLREISPTMYFNVPKGWEEVARALKADPELRKKYYARVQMQFYAGAALGQSVWDDLFASAEMECGERIVMSTGLGMTESSPSALYVRTPTAQAGDIGTPMPGVSLKLVPNGDKLELRYKGPSVTPGYWRMPQETAEAFDDEGYFCTGDAVKWKNAADPQQGFVFDGRVAEDFKLYTGTWVSVGPLRSRVQAAGAPWVLDSVVTGHDRDAVGLLLYVHEGAVRELSGLPASATLPEALAAGPVRAKLQSILNSLHTQGTGSSNRPTRLMVIDSPLSMDRGELTDKGSINQRAVLKERAAMVEALYAGTDPRIVFAQKA